MQVRNVSDSRTPLRHAVREINSRTLIDRDHDISDYHRRGHILPLPLANPAARLLLMMLMVPLPFLLQVPRLLTGRFTLVVGLSPCRCARQSADRQTDGPTDAATEANSAAPINRPTDRRTARPTKPPTDRRLRRPPDRLTHQSNDRPTCGQSDPLTGGPTEGRPQKR